MSRQRGVDRLLVEFYRDGPASLPPEFQRELLAHLATAPQIGRWAAPPRRFQASGRAALALALGVSTVVALGLALDRFGAFTGPAPSASGPSAAAVERFGPRSAPTSWPLFRSSRYGYSLRHPEAFISAEVPGTFIPTELMNAPGTDQLNAPGVAQVAIGRLAVAQATSLSEWRSQARLKEGDCRLERTGTTTIGGAQAIVDLSHCGSRYVQVAYVVEGGYGFEVYWTSAGADDAADLETFLQIIGSVEFSP